MSKTLDSLLPKETLQECLKNDIAMGIISKSDAFMQKDCHQRTTLHPWGFDIDCLFEYYPGEKAIYWPTELSHPGAPDNCQLLACEVGGINIIEMLSDEQIERIEEEILIQFES